MSPSQVKREPRDYQIQAVENFFEARSRGIRKMMLVLATGTGKTFCFSLLIQTLLEKENARIMVVAHRDELITQAVGSLSEMIPRGQIGIVKARQRESHYPVVVASVQSVANDKQRANMPKFDLIVIDESHRSLSKSYRAVIENLLTANGCVLGVTATPQRADGRALAEVYQEIILQMGLPEAIQKGWLCNLVAQRVKLKSDFSGLKLKAQTDGERDYDAKEICSIMDRENWEKDITDAWLMYASERKTIGFLPSVAFAHRLAAYMVSRDIKAVAIDGTTDKADRRQAIEGFGRDYQVLLNCALLVEGVDLPSADCILSATMTASLGRYMQSVGRGTRKAEGKENCLILDVVGVSKKNKIQQSFNLGCLTECYVCQIQSSLEYKNIGYDENGETAHACAQCHRQIKCGECQQSGKDKYFIVEDQKFICQECKPIGEARARALKNKRAAKIEGYQSVDLLAESDQGKKDKGRFTDVRQRRIGRYTWEENVGAKTLTLTLDDRSLSVVHYAAEDERPEYYHYYSSDVFDGFEGRAATRIDALRACEEEIGDHALAPSLPVNGPPASAKQMDLLHKFRIPYDPNLTIKQASAIIGAHFAARDARKMAVGA